MKYLVWALWLLLIHGALHNADAQSSSRNLSVTGSLAIEGGLQAVHADQSPERPWVYALGTNGQLLVIDVATSATPALVYQGPPENAQALTSFMDSSGVYLVLGGEQLSVLNVSDPRSPVVSDHAMAANPVADLFAYKHSSGEVLVMSAGSESASIYSSRLSDGPLITLETPDHPGPGEGFEDVYAGFEPNSQQDRLYLAAAGGYYVYDITNLASPTLQTTIHSAAVQRGRVIAPISDGNHALTLASYRTAPMRIFSLSQPRVRTAAGAWIDNWQSELVDVVVRWPFAFVAALEDGLHVVNIFDPFAPYHDAWFRSSNPAIDETPPLMREPHGIMDLDVRNHDGLIIAADLDYGLWLLELDAFMGWHGHAWGLPNVSDVQDWENGPDGK